MYPVSLIKIDVYFKDLYSYYVDMNRMNFVFYVFLTVIICYVYSNIKQLIYGFFTFNFSSEYVTAFIITGQTKVADVLIF